MPPCQALVVHRGEDVGDPTLREVSREVLGGHIRPDTDLAVVISAPIRIDKGARGSADPLAGTVRALHWVVPAGADAPWTGVSELVLQAHMGTGPADRPEIHAAFGDVVHEALGARLSEECGPVVTLSLRDDPPLGGYALFSQGRRLWSARYRPGVHYASWDGDELRIEPMALDDPPPPEGAHSDFACHGVLLLFRTPVELTWNERIHLFASLIRAAHQPKSSARGLVVAEQGRFLDAPRAFTEEDWARFTLGLDDAPEP